MTLPSEQMQAIKKAGDFLKELLRELLVGKITAKRRDEIRVKAYWCLRHYPCDLQIESYWMGGEWESGKWPPLRKEKDKEMADGRRSEAGRKGDPARAVHRGVRPRRSPRKG